MKLKFWKKKEAEKNKSTGDLLLDELKTLSIMDRLKIILQCRIINSQMNPTIIEEETVSVASKVNKTRLGFPYESEDFFKSKKIFYPRGTPENEVSKLRAEARDICWKDVHEAELDLARGHGQEDWKTDWMRIQEYRRKQNEFEVLEELEREKTLNDRLKEETIPVIQDEMPVDKPAGSSNVAKMIKNIKKLRNSKNLDDLKQQAMDIVEEEFGEPDESVAEFLIDQDIDNDRMED